MIHFGGIASGNTLLKDETFRDNLRDNFGAKAVEMEGGGVALGAHRAGKSTYIIRGICDYCNKHKNDTWQNYAAGVAAAFALALIEFMTDSTSSS